MPPKTKKKKYRVDIQFTTEFTYEVEATSPEEAEEKARREYERGEDTYDSSEVFDAEVTGAKEI